MRSFINNQNGFVVFISLIMVMISLGYTVGYLHFVMGERIIFMQRYAETRARYNALSGLSEQMNGLIRSENYNTASDTTLDDEEIESMIGGYKDLYADMLENQVTHRSQRHGRATGWSTYNSFTNLPIEVEYTMQVNYRSRGFEEFMYLTNEEAPGGGPWLGETVTFGANEELEGLVYSNDNITMSNFGCPHFINDPVTGEYSQVYTAGTFNMASCSENIFEGVFRDSMPEIEWPPYEGQDLIKSKADYIYHGDSQIDIFSTDPDVFDHHIMTHIEFLESGGFVVKQWLYELPPKFNPAGEPPPATTLFNDTLRMYYPKYFRDTHGGSEGMYRGDLEFQHFDFPEPPNPDDLLTNQLVMANEAVVWVEGGQVQVEGTVKGRYTIATSGPKPYRMYYDNETIQHLNCNIWIMDDLLYEDSDNNGYVVDGSPNRLGLLSGGNIIVANTRANGKKNRQMGGADIRINAAMIAMNESFLIQYWQNSTTDYNFLDGMAIKGDRRGTNAFSSPTGASDIRGIVMIYGSVVQEKRGYLKRNNPGPYAISPGIGYDKDYHYDRNLRTFPPPEWPETKNSDGSSNLVLSGIGEYLGE